MPITVNFELPRGTDGILTLQMEPPVNTSGWDIHFQVQKRFGASSGLFDAWCGSNGLNNVSGINMRDGNQGILDITVKGIYTSGLPFANYAHTTTRTNSGFNTLLSQGYLALTPSQPGG